MKYSEKMKSVFRKGKGNVQEKMKWHEKQNYSWSCLLLALD